MVSLDHPVFVGLKNAGSRFFDLDHPVITLGSPHGSHLFIDFSVTLDVLEMHVYDCVHALIAVEKKEVLRSHRFGRRLGFCRGSAAWFRGHAVHELYTSRPANCQTSLSPNSSGRTRSQTSNNSNSLDAHAYSSKAIVE